MKIIEKISEKSRNLMDGDIPVIAFLGDSVTQGCFELYDPVEGKPLETVFDAENGYHSHLKKMLSLLYPNVPVTMINAGISGDNAPHGYRRLEKDVLRFNPDLVVVSFGLNDCTGGAEGLTKYKEALCNIFTDVKKSGAECIFMTENMMNTYVSDRITDDFLRGIAKNTMELEKNGILKMYFDTAKETAKMCGAVVCDVYSKWKRLEENGVDTTALLSNHINHPLRRMNRMFACSLIETMMNN